MAAKKESPWVKAMTGSAEANEGQERSKMEDEGWTKQHRKER